MLACVLCDDLVCCLLLLCLYCMIGMILVTPNLLCAALLAADQPWSVVLSSRLGASTDPGPARPASGVAGALQGAIPMWRGLAARVGRGSAHMVVADNSRRDLLSP